ncbi:MAG: CCA tRNA nucleotidyltransferase [Pseudomonadota bacterium]
MTRLTAEWITRASTRAVLDALQTEGHRAFFVGGCVRNDLLGAPVSDIDVATDAMPHDVMRLAKAADLNPIPTGIDHGTVTIVSDHIAHEVTTFRRDVETDGRRAVVAYSSEMDEDARRRDFTMNALYADAEGHVIDPLGTGLADLADRRVRFIEDATARIREDYLRILRFFRFHAWYGSVDAGPDPGALDAIAGNLDGLGGLSAERVGAEMLKLLGAPDPAPSVAVMAQTGALGQVLPGADPRALAPLVHLEGQHALAADPIRRLAALGGADVAQRLRLSRRDGKRLATLGEAVGSGQGTAEMGYRFGARAAVDAALIRAASLGTEAAEETVAQAEAGASAVFPVRARDLGKRYRGAAIGEALRRLESAWVASGFRLDKDALLQKLDAGD